MLGSDREKDWSKSRKASDVVGGGETMCEKWERWQNKVENSSEEMNSEKGAKRV